MKRLINKLIFFCGFWCSADALGTQSAAIESVFEQYRTIFDESLKSVDREWVLSPIKKINGRWRAQHSRWLTGPMHRQTFEIDRISVDALVNKIIDFSSDQDWVVEFECHGFDCGRSYAWATEIFDNNLLHGADKLQHYWVWRDADRWLSVYLVERANKKLFLQFMAMSPDNTKQEALFDQWNAQGYALIYANPSQFNAAWSDDQLLRLAVEWVQQRGFKQLAVVGHNHLEGQTFKAQEAMSLTQAEFVAKALKDALSTISVNTYGLGALVPRHQLASRVEIVPIGS